MLELGLKSTFTKLWQVLVYIRAQGVGNIMMVLVMFAHQEGAPP